MILESHDAPLRLCMPTPVYHYVQKILFPIGIRIYLHVCHIRSKILLVVHNKTSSFKSVLQGVMTCYDFVTNNKNLKLLADSPQKMWELTLKLG